MGTRKLSSHMEDYLETIASLVAEGGVARVRDVGRRLGVRNSSVNAAVGTLSAKKLVQHERYGDIELTPSGGRLAGEVQKRHDTLLAFLTEVLDINPKTADKDACQMEHVISPQTLDKLTQFMRTAQARKMKK